MKRQRVCLLLVLISALVVFTGLMPRVLIQHAIARVSLTGLSSLRAERSNPGFTVMRREASNSLGSIMRVDLRLRRSWILTVAALPQDDERGARLRHRVTQARESEPISFDDLRARVDAIANGEQGDLSGIDAVILPDGKVTRWTGPTLPPGQFQRKQAQQLSLALGEITSSGVYPVDPAHAREVAREILKPQPKPKPNWLKRLLQKLSDWLSGIFKGFSGTPSQFVASVVKLLVLALVTLAITAIIALIVRALIRSTRKHRAKKKQTDETTIEGRALEHHGHGPSEPIDWDRRAQEAATRGDYSNAVRFLHHAGILRLDDASVIAFDPARTNGTYASLLAERDTVAARSLRKLNQTVEVTAFGRVEADAQTFNTSHHLWTGLFENLSPPVNAGAPDDGRPQ